MLLESGHRSMVAWNFMFSICFLSISLSICARMERSRFEAKWEPERPLYTRAKNRSTNSRKRERRGDRERGHALAKSEARDLRFNQSGESREPSLCDETHNEKKSWAGEKSSCCREWALEHRMAKCENWPETEPIFIYVQFVSAFYTMPYDCRMRHPLSILFQGLCVYIHGEKFRQ
jgi:hypothetical protein